MLMDLPEELKILLQVRRRSHSQLTLVTGVFDVLHQEHRQFLQAAKKLSNILVIGLESDQRVRQLKGRGRPINAVAKRKENLQQWGIADVIFVLPADFDQEQVRRAWLEAIKPDYLAVSSHTPFLAIKKKELELVGGQVKIVHQFNPQVSSSKLIDKKTKSKKE
jgi:D-beta-D-heptose 7-phosphate kinase / D-beta-D-heptose 1-phosphate adenosyltransferase